MFHWNRTIFTFWRGTRTARRTTIAWRDRRNDAANATEKSGRSIPEFTRWGSRGIGNALHATDAVSLKFFFKFSLRTNLEIRRNLGQNQIDATVSQMGHVEKLDVANKMCVALESRNRGGAFYALKTDLLLRIAAAVYCVRIEPFEHDGKCAAITDKWAAPPPFKSPNARATNSRCLSCGYWAIWTEAELSNCS